MSNSGDALDPFALNVLVKTRDELVAQELERVCGERGHSLVRLEGLNEVRYALARARPNVLLLDLPCAITDASLAAAAIAAVHPSLSIVLVSDWPEARSIGRFRVVDRWRAGERIADELELAYIGIPATVEQSVEGRL